MKPVQQYIIGSLKKNEKKKDTRKLKGNRKVVFQLAWLEEG